VTHRTWVNMRLMSQVSGLGQRKFFIHRFFNNIHNYVSSRNQIRFRNCGQRLLTDLRKAWLEVLDDYLQRPDGS